MKKFFKILFSSLGILLMCLMIFGQVAKMAMKPSMDRAIQHSEFARAIERADRDCPIPVALGKGAVTGIKLEGSYVTYYLSYDSDFMNVLSGVNDEEKVKEGILMCFLCINAQGRNQGDLVMDLLIKEDCGIKVVVTKSATGRFECSATVDEIKVLRDRFRLNPHEALYNLLTLSVESEKATLPMDLGDGMIMTDYSLNGDNIVVAIEIDERQYSISDLIANKEYIKSSMLNEALNQPESKALLDLCKVSHTGLVYRYYGNHSHKAFKIEFPSDEIRRTVKTPSNVNIQ
jgi:hypothetical protein